MKKTIPMIVLASTLAVGCAPAPKEVSSAAPSAPMTSAAPAAGAASAPSDLPMPSMQSTVKWDAPKGWQTGPEKPMRAATYMIPAAAGDGEGAECAVFVNIGGGVQANVDRWIGQFEQPGGGSSADKAKTDKKTISGMNVTLIDLTGTFKGGGAMMNPGAPAPGPKTGYRLLGAIVESKGGPVYFKMTGPAKTMAAAQADFNAMLASLKE